MGLIAETAGVFEFFGGFFGLLPLAVRLLAGGVLGLFILIGILNLFNKG